MVIFQLKKLHFSRFDWPNTTLPMSLQAVTMATALAKGTSSSGPRIL